MRIPLHVWQTHKTPSPPAVALGCMASWKKFNPDCFTHYCDDIVCLRFIERWFSPAFVEMYLALPVGVMRADVWRVAILYVYGGIYADIDAECLSPVGDWIGNQDELVVAVENETGALANFAFASVPGHPALLSVLELFMKLYASSSFLDPTSRTPVQDFGAGGFSLGILSRYGLANQVAMRKGGAFYGLCQAALGEGVRFYSHESRIITPYRGKNTKVFHHTASVFWLNQYSSWRGDQERLFGFRGS